MNTCLVPSYLFEAWSVEQLKSPNLQISELHFHQQTQGSLPLSSFLTFRWSHNCLLPLERSIHKLHPNHKQKELHCTRSRPKHLWAHKKNLQLCSSGCQSTYLLIIQVVHCLCACTWFHACSSACRKPQIQAKTTIWITNVFHNISHFRISLSCWMPILTRLQSGHSAHMLLQRDVKKSATPSGVIEWIHFASWEGYKGREHDNIFQVSC